MKQKGLSTTTVIGIALIAAVLVVVVIYLYSQGKLTGSPVSNYLPSSPTTSQIPTSSDTTSLEQELNADDLDSGNGDLTALDQDLQGL